MPPRKIQQQSGLSTKRSQSSSKSDKRSRIGIKKGKGKEEEQSELSDNEQIIETIIEEPPKKASWLDTLIYEPPPDQELHKKLSSQRHEKEKKKRYDHCYNELISILTYAMEVNDLQKEFKEGNDYNELNLKKAIRRKRVAFENGEYYPKEPEKPENRLSVMTKPCIPGSITAPNVGRLLIAEKINVNEKIYELMKDATERSDFQYDANSEFDVLLKKLHQEMLPYTNPGPDPELAAFPFLACVTGPPCSGKTSITDFLQQHFKTYVINIYNSEEREMPTYQNQINIFEPDDKLIPQAIVNALVKLPEDYGCILSGYPLTKGQFGIVDKAVQQISRHKSKAHLSDISIIIRTSMTIEEAEKAAETRQVDRKTGRVYSSKFNPCNVLELKNGADLFTPEPDFSGFQKIASSTAGLDSLTKRGTAVTAIGYCDLERMQLAVENVVRQAFDTKAIPASFTTFVGIRNHKKLEFAKQCADIVDIWDKQCTPLYAAPLAELYTRMARIHSKTDYLKSCALERFALILSQPDSRPQMASEGKGFDVVWNESIRIRDMGLSELPQVLATAGFDSLVKMLDSDQQPLFESLLNRLYLILWFTREFKEAAGGKMLESIPRPVLPVFNLGDLNSVAKELGIKCVELPDVCRSVEKIQPNEKVIKGGMYHSSTVEQIPMEVPNVKPSNDEGKSKPNRPFDTHISFDIEAEEDGEEMPLKRFSREESMRNFLNFVMESMNIKLVHYDAKLILDIFDYLISNKAIIESELNRCKRDLEEKMKDWVQRKYASEMEHFSKSFSASNANSAEEIEKESKKGYEFAYEKRFYEGTDLPNVERLGFKFNASEPFVTDIEHGLELARKVAGKQIVNIDELVEIARPIFGDEDTEKIEAFVRMKTVPLYIDVLSLCLTIAPPDAHEEIKSILKKGRQKAVSSI